MLDKLIPSVLAAALAAGCASVSGPPPVSPRFVTEQTRHDSDDPAIWINAEDPSASLVVGTDKDTDGALYLYDLQGRVVNRVADLKRPNNVDVAYGLRLGDGSVDVAVVTEREAQRLRVFSLPDMRPLDRGDLIVFGGDLERAPMGIALYKRPRDGALFAIVSGKSGPREGYLGQYRLEDDGTGMVKATLVRQFGAFSGKKEIESVAVDGALGYVYYSDEQAAVRKYRADPDAPDAGRELATISVEDYAADNEGVSIYETSDTEGYILVSDQDAHQFRIYPREGADGNPHHHPLIKTVKVRARESDGSEATSVPLPPYFPHGLFVAMSTDRTFHFYAWEDIAGEDLKVGRAP